MYIIRNYSIPPAVLTALTPASFYWITTQQTGVLPLTTGKPNDYFDLSPYDYVKFHFSTNGLTTSAGGVVGMGELWPDVNGQALGSGNNQVSSHTINPTLTTSPQSSQIDFGIYSTPASLTQGTGTSICWKGGIAALYITFTTVPTAGTLQIIVTGSRYGHEG